MKTQKQWFANSKKVTVASIKLVDYLTVKSCEWNGETNIYSFEETGMTAPEEDLKLYITEIKFLDMTIRDSGNGDGVTLVSPQWTSIANFGTDWEAAKLYAVRWFMIQRPNIFAKSLSYRLLGMGGSYWEFGLMTNALKKENIDIPEGLEEGDGMNRLIYFKGKKV